MTSTRQLISEYSKERRRWKQRRGVAFVVLFIAVLVALVSVVLDSVSSTVFLATLLVAVVSAFAALVFSVQASRGKLTAEHVDLHAAFRSPPPVPAAEAAAERDGRAAQPQSRGAHGRMAGSK